MEAQQETTFTALVVIAIAAFVTPILVSRVKRIAIPVVVGELVIGILIGRSGLNLVTHAPWLEFLSTLGITYLMFLSGVEIDFRLLRRLWHSQGGRSVFAVTGGYFGLVVLLGLVCGFAFQAAGLIGNPWFVALILATVSVGVVLPTIKERGLGSTEYGQTILVIALFFDFATMLLLTALVTFVSGEDPGRLLLTAILFIGGFVAYLGGNRLRRTAIMRELAHATAQIGVRGSFMLIFIFAFLSQNLGVEVILGAFLAGAIVSLISQTDETSLHLKLDAIGFGFLVPIFFIMVGVELDLAALAASPRSIVLALSIIVVAYVIKILPALLFVRRYPLHKAVGIGVLVTPGLSLTVAAAEIGFRLGILSPSSHSAMILLAIVTAAVSPVIFQRLVPHDEAGPAGERVVIVGADERGRLLATRLGDFGTGLVLVDKDPSEVERARRRGFQAHRIDATNPEEWRRLDLLHPETTVVIATQNDAVNLEVAEVLRKVCGVERVVCHAGDPGIARELNRMNVRTVSPSFAAISMMEHMVRHPDLVALLNREDDDIDIVKTVVENPALTRVPLRRLDLPEGALILAIGRGKEHIIPRGETRLRLGDVLTVAARAQEAAAAIKRLEEFRDT